MSRRQERAARRARIADKQATAVIEKATTRVRTSPTPPSPQGQAEEVRRLRDSGMAWWAIGQKLGLAGPAKSASESEGKRGAGAARRLYAAANRGVVPRTQAPRKGTIQKPQGPATSGTLTSRKERLVNEGHVIPRDMSDEEVEAYVVGRGIDWAVDMARLTNTDPETWGTEEARFMKLSARVHVDPQWVKVYTDEEKNQRLLHFREYMGYDTDRGRHMSGPTRTIRVDAIYNVR